MKKSSPQRRSDVSFEVGFCLFLVTLCFFLLLSTAVLLSLPMLEFLRLGVASIIAFDSLGDFLCFCELDAFVVLLGVVTTFDLLFFEELVAVIVVVALADFLCFCELDAFVVLLGVVTTFDLLVFEELVAVVVVVALAVVVDFLFFDALALDIEVSFVALNDVAACVRQRTGRLGSIWNLFTLQREQMGNPQLAPLGRINTQ
jgi:hypothetical protein